MPDLGPAGDPPERARRFPVRLSLNVSHPVSEHLERLTIQLGEARGVVARRALERGLRLLADAYRKRRKRRSVERRGEERRGAA